jgi:hypothetical protein
MRKASATMLAERGATASELCAIFGWTKLSTADVYVKKANRRTMAATGLNKLNQLEDGSKIVPLRATSNGGGTKQGENRDISTVPGWVGGVCSLSRTRL